MHQTGQPGILQPGSLMDGQTIGEGFEMTLVQDVAEGNILTIGHTTGFELG